MPIIRAILFGTGITFIILMGIAIFIYLIMVKWLMAIIFIVLFLASMSGLVYAYVNEGRDDEF